MTEFPDWPRRVDRYTRSARIAPAMIVALPLALGAAIWFSPTAILAPMLSGAGVLFALTVLLGQLGRDAGKRKQSHLVSRWGGMPTTRMLRHRDGILSAETRQRYHAKLSALLPSITMPTAASEHLDPEGADLAYASCVSHLLERTRDPVRFPLILEENINYGFRRNLWGLKPIGIWCTCVGLVAAIAQLVLSQRAQESLAGRTIAAIVLDAFLLALWIWYINPSWVKIAADAYAERLLGACDVL